MKVDIQDTYYGDGSMKDVIFDDAYAVKVPAELAESIKARCEFRYGIKNEGVLVAVFKDECDRDFFRSELKEVWPAEKWEEVTL